jgi:hypothetical protein
MITPLLRMPIKGAIWYQGETDTNAGGAPAGVGSHDRAQNYNCTLPAMVRDWRSKFHVASGGATAVDFPFGIVQLAPWSLGGGKDANNGCRDGDDHTCQVATLRWGQTANVGNLVANPALPRTFMAVSTDLADFSSPMGSIHPRHKIPVGDRLALGARAVAYSEEGVYYTGPINPTAMLLGARGGMAGDWRGGTTNRGGMVGADGRGGATKRGDPPMRVVRVDFERCDAHGIELRETVGFEVSIGGKWSAVTALRNQTLQLVCALELDVSAALAAPVPNTSAAASVVAGAGAGVIVGASGSNGEGGQQTDGQRTDVQRTGSYSLRYNWFRSTCFANETKGGLGAGRCAVYSGGLPAPPFRISITPA